MPLKLSQVGPVKFEKINIGGTTDFAANVRVTAFYPRLLRGGTVYFAFNIVKIKGEWLIKKRAYIHIKNLKKGAAKAPFLLLKLIYDVYVCVRIPSVVYTFNPFGIKCKHYDNT